MKKSLYKYALVAALIFTNVLMTMAQPGDGGFGDDPDDVPVDGGIAILAVAGIAYGIRAYKNRTK